MPINKRRVYVNGVFVPESQRWTLKESERKRIERGLEWAAKNPPKATDLDQLLSLVRKKD